MRGDSEGSTNAVDRLLGHTDGPKTAPSKRDATRLQYSKQIVVVNFTRLSNWCDDIATDGLIYIDKKADVDPDTIRVNIFTDIHNYLSSVYSFVEELHQIIDGCVDGTVDKKTFVRGASRKSKALPPFVRKLVFAWGLRNQFTHGNYRCLTIVEERDAYQPHMRVRFHKKKFDPRGEGDLKAVGDYLWGVETDEVDNPMCYFAKLNKHLLEFWTDTEDWFRRTTS